MSEKEDEDSKRVCTVCGHKMPSDEYVCSHCGNVFRKNEKDWDWKLIPRGRAIKKDKAKEESDEEADDD